MQLLNHVTFPSAGVQPALHVALQSARAQTTRIHEGKNLAIIKTKAAPAPNKTKVKTGPSTTNLPLYQYPVVI